MLAQEGDAPKQDVGVKADDVLLDNVGNGDVDSGEPLADEVEILKDEMDVHDVGVDGVLLKDVEVDVEDEHLPVDGVEVLDDDVDVEGVLVD